MWQNFTGGCTYYHYNLLSTIYTEILPYYWLIIWFLKDLCGKYCLASVPVVFPIQSSPHARVPGGYSRTRCHKIISYNPVNKHYEEVSINGFIQKLYVVHVLTAFQQSTIAFHSLMGHFWIACQVHESTKQLNTFTLGLKVVQSW